MRERNPINFADQVTAPVMFIIGENDSRCPLRQAMAYVERLADRGHPHEVYLFGTGHSSFDMEEEIRQHRAILAFLAQTVPSSAWFCRLPRIDFRRTTDTPGGRCW